MAERIFVVFTTDYRLPSSPVRFDSAFTTQELADEQKDKLNAEDLSFGNPPTVRFSSVVPLLLRDEPTDD